MNELLNNLIFAGVGVAVALLLVKALLTLRNTHTVFDYQQGVLFHDGKFKELLGPGRYSFWGSRHSIEIVDLREKFEGLHGQEIMTSEGVSVRITLIMRFRIVDAKAYVTKVQGAAEAAYVTVQVALREVVGSLKADELLEARSEIAPRVFDLAKSPVSDLGIELNAIDVRDIMFPSELKTMMTQVVRAQKEGQAALERARGETAALRHLANAAKMLEGNPALMQLRILQSLSEAKGVTLVLNASEASPVVTGSNPE